MICAYMYIISVWDGGCQLVRYRPIVLAHWFVSVRNISINCVYQCPEMRFGVFLNGDVVSTVDLYKTHLVDICTFHKALICWRTLGL